MKRSDYIKYLWLLLLALPPVAVLILLREEAFRFEHKEYLWVLWAVVPMLLLFLYFQNWRSRNLAKFANSSLLGQLTPDVSFNKHLLKFILLSLAFQFIVIGFANPQVGTKQEKVKRQGIDVFIAIDVSNSMLSEDIKPNRLMRAKNFISNFIDELHNDRLGMIVFAGRAYLQMPLTVDYSAGRMYLKTVNTNLMPTQGTNIAEAVNMARENFVKEDNKHKALIIITDGEDNEGGTDEAIADAVKEGVKVFTIGVGTDNGGPIPVGSDFKRDESGNIVLSKMNQPMLRELAAKGNGKYFQLGSGKDEINAIFKELGRINTKDFEEVVFTDFNDQFQICLIIAAVLLLIEWFVSERKLRFKF
ncbi:MAG TPA: VWA domain-containing protein [Chitinophagales bacterium]|nr:VWA domain-containing protein [Chitinophagales bacterium]